MPKEFSRAVRISELIRRELSCILQQEFEEFGSAFITISDVHVVRDLSQARVFVSLYPAEEQHESLAKKLNQASGFLRTKLASAIHMKYTPKLRFIYDTSVAEKARLASLMNNLKE